MGIKERERRVEVFFYGLFMDEELLRGKGLDRFYGQADSAIPFVDSRNRNRSGASGRVGVCCHDS